MYPRNAASPERIAIGPVVLIADGTVQTSGVTVRVIPSGGSEADGAGTTAYSTDGVVIYTPTQAETNYTSFVLIAKKTACIPASVTVVTSASSTAGHAGTDQSKITNATATVNLSSTTIKTATDVETDTQDIQNRLPAALVDGRMAANAQVVGDKSGYTLTQAFPANFSLLGIGATGEILTVQTVEELAETALTANGAIDSIPPAVWNALTTETYVDGSFGDRLLISLNNTRSVAVTGSGHVASVLHDAEPNSIPEDAFVTGALSARVLAADAATEIATAVAAPTAATIADAVWDEILVGHLGAGSTGEALNNSGGSGNPWITDIATGYSGTQAGNVLNQVKAKTDLITSGTPIQTSIPVTAQGQITGPLYIGDDYLTANGRAFDWTIPLPSGFVAGTSTCKFGMIYEDETGVSQFNLAGTVTDVGGGNVRLRFELLKATTGTLKAGFHRWSVEIVSTAGVEVTAVAYNDRKLVEWREKQT